MLTRPYGILARQYASGSRKRERAPALHRIATWLDLECAGWPPLSGAQQARTKAIDRRYGNPVGPIVEAEKRFALLSKIGKS